MPTANLDHELDRIANLNLAGLRDAWPARFGPPPRTRSADFLRRTLAWKLQEEAHGGLDPVTRKLLTQTTKPTSTARLGVGTRLVREWKGERHEVEVGADGEVTYRGQTYASLSEAAREITGTRWNGPRFFGLRGAL